MTRGSEEQGLSGLFQVRICPGPQPPPHWTPSPVSLWLLGTGGCTGPPWKSGPAGSTRECCFLSPSPSCPAWGWSSCGGMKELGLFKFKGTLPAGGPGAAHPGFSCPDSGATPRACTPKPSPPLPLQAETGHPPRERILGLPCVISPWFAGASGTPGAAGTQRIERGRGKRDGCPQGV